MPPLCEMLLYAGLYRGSGRRSNRSAGWSGRGLNGALFDYGSQGVPRGGLQRRVVRGLFLRPGVRSPLARTVQPHRRLEEVPARQLLSGFAVPAHLNALRNAAVSSASASAGT